jgi:hypothetical protein
VGLEIKIYCAGEGQQQFNWLTDDLKRVVRQSRAGKDMSTEAEEYPLLGATGEDYNRLSLCYSGL